MSDVALSVFNAQGEINMGIKKQFNKKNGKFEYEFDVVGHHAAKIRVQADNKEEAMVRANEFLELKTGNDMHYYPYAAHKIKRNTAYIFRLGLTHGESGELGVVEVRYRAKFRLNHHGNHGHLMDDAEKSPRIERITEEERLCFIKKINDDFKKKDSA